MHLSPVFAALLCFVTINCTTYTVDPSRIKMYWADKSGQPYKSFARLHQEHPLSFTMNGGMYTQDYKPLGLYIENGRKIRPLKIYKNSKVNFGMQPQAVFYITEGGQAGVCPATSFKEAGVKFATQSAPMLVIDGKINPRLTNSSSRYVRNGVGILKNGMVLLVCTNEDVTFQEFAAYFKAQGCVNAMYLDGVVSKARFGQETGKGRRSYGYGVFIGVQ